MEAVIKVIRQFLILSGCFVMGNVAFSAPIGRHCTAITDVVIVDSVSGHLEPHRTVVIRGRSIDRIVPSRGEEVPRGCQKVIGQGRFLIPGLVDSHVHFFGYIGAGAGNRDVERDILLMLLANGVTTAVVMEGTPNLLTLRDRVAAGSLAGPRLYVAGRFIQMTGSGVLPGRRAFDTPEDVRAEVVQEKEAGYDFIKVHGDLPAITYSTLLDTARREGIPVVGHVPNNLGIHVALAGGQEMITHAESYIDSYFRFGRELPTNDAEMESMVKAISKESAEAHIYVQPTLSVFRQIITEVADIDALLQRPEVKNLPERAILDWEPPNNPYVKRWKLTDLPALRSQYSLMQKLVRGLRDAGVPLLVGTDPMVPVQLPGFSMRDEMEQLVEAGLTPFEVLQAATWNQAEFLGTTSKSGSIALGKVADLVLLDANPLDDVSSLSKQDGVMLRGHWYPESELQRMLKATKAAPSSPASP